MENGQEDYSQQIIVLSYGAFFLNLTPAKTNKCPLKGAISKGKSRLPTTIFQETC